MQSQGITADTVLHATGLQTTRGKQCQPDHLRPRSNELKNTGDFWCCAAASAFSGINDFYLYTKLQQTAKEKNGSG
jgi:hypothetical protein